MTSLRQATRSASQSAFLRTSSLATQSSSISPAYKQLLSTTKDFKSPSNNIPLLTSSQYPLIPLSLLRSPFIPETIATLQSRTFHQTPRWYQEQTQQPAQTTKPDPKSADPKKQSEQTASGPESEAKPDSEEQAKQEGDQSKEEGQEKKEEKKEDLPPPPPHGDKTPWQVFMETMQSEFKASKEWNESTKQLADSAHSFTESESVRRARQAYENTTGAVSSTAGRVLKSSATAVGKGAAWTWETPVMKGVRKGANLTGDILEKATKPIRETEAYKNVKNVIDDGSSSRYGGWVEKEERRKARELREKQSRSISGKAEEIVEDPK